ncbi:septum formation family protein [Actinoplanes sp. NPDC048796]|uniref:septum formation family protein n=1 Tax=Actinoplanes sp. NPDC048796 TaxID=3155640 RepID=UPI0033C6C7BC
MRRWAAVLAGALMFALAGCGELPQGVDGDLTDGWHTPPAALQFRPTDGCHADLAETSALGDDGPVSCQDPHVAETFAVADLGEVTTATREAKAFQECSTRANGYVGGDWRTGWLLLQPVFPSDEAWSGGARWVRCDLAETSPSDGTLVRRSSSVRDGLKGAANLKMTCADAAVQGDQVTGLRTVSCAAEHTSEFAGLFVSKRPTSAAVTSAEMEKGCNAAIAKFTGVPNDNTIKNRVGWLGFPPDKDSWRQGDRAVRCFLWLNGEKMTGSYRNAGTKKLKIHYTYR